MSESAKKVAVVGATGIGKHHANWWHVEGARVCAFAGTTPESVAETRGTLQDMFGFDGRGYTDTAEMLQKETPDILDVCSPPRFHYDHTLAGLEAGCEVLCEKPFVYEEGLDAGALLQKARTLAETAEDRSLSLGMCSQYHPAVRVCREILLEQTGQSDITTFLGHLASPAKTDSPDPDAIWVDLAPHMLAALQALLPDATIKQESLTTSFDDLVARADFSAASPDGPGIACEIVTGKTRPGAEQGHIRLFELNGQRFEIGGGTDEEDNYCARIDTPWGVFQYPDGMRLLIREFLDGRPAIGPRAAVQNINWVLQILGR
jgi:predicted dehydrogenase